MGQAIQPGQDAFLPVRGRLAVRSRSTRYRHDRDCMRANSPRLLPNRRPRVDFTVDVPLGDRSKEFLERILAFRNWSDHQLAFYDRYIHKRPLFDAGLYGEALGDSER